MAGTQFSENYSGWKRFLYGSGVVGTAIIRVFPWRSVCLPPALRRCCLRRRVSRCVRFRLDSVEGPRGPAALLLSLPLRRSRTIAFAAVVVVGKELCRRKKAFLVAPEFKPTAIQPRDPGSRDDRTHENR